MQEIINAFNRAVERIGEAALSLWERYMALVGQFQRILFEEGMTGRAVIVVAVLVAMAVLSSCEAGGQFDYACDDTGYCYGDASWWVEYPDKEE